MYVYCTYGIVLEYDSKKNTPGEVLSKLSNISGFPGREGSDSVLSGSSLFFFKSESILQKRAAKLQF